MRLSLFSASSLLFLLGCPTTVIVDPPEAPEVVRLESGSYGVLVTDVLEVDCDGANGEDLFGMELPMELKMGRGGGATADLSGLLLSGGMSGGTLALDGDLVTTQEHEQEYGEVDGEVDEEAVEPCAVPDEEGDEDVEPVDCSDEDRPDQPSHGGGRDGVVSLEIVASRTDHGTGFLALSDRQCRLELVVEVQAVSRGDDPPPVHTTGEEAECDDSKDVDGDRSDCG